MIERIMTVVTRLETRGLSFPPLTPLLLPLPSLCFYPVPPFLHNPQTPSPSLGLSIPIFSVPHLFLFLALLSCLLRVPTQPLCFVCLPLYLGFSTPQSKHFLVVSFQSPSRSPISILSHPQIRVCIRSLPSRAFLLNPSPS